ncbi:MMPL family transporter [Streptomyces sp. NPDC057099]|uniref:MMPL family transporter n=1 Tax=Streptomyces sp. NPDC057099 TaxID=3346019 RepID=UPI0036396502
MAALLYRLGRMAFRRRWLVAALWVVVLGAVGFASTKAPAPPDDTASMNGIEAQSAYDLLQRRFPGTSDNADTASAKIVFVAPEGQKVTASDNRATIEKLVDTASEGSQVEATVSPFRAGAVSKSGSTAYAIVTYKAKSKDVTDSTKQHLQTAVDEARKAGLTVDVGGPVLAAQAAAGGSSEAIGIAIAALVLLVTFGSMTAAGLPLLTAVLGVGLSMVSIMALGSTFGLSTTSSSLASMLGLAVGIDYALFVVSRYREERAKDRGPQEAAGVAVGTAGSAVVFAGLTVVIALAGLSVVGVPTLTKMGLSAAGAVVIAVLVALTLVPALLGLFPNAVLSRRIRKGKQKSGTRRNAGTRWARFVLRRPLPVLLASVAVLGALALPVMDMQLGMPGDESKSTATTERRAYDELAEGFGPGFNGPLTVVVDAQGAKDPRTAVTAITEEISDTAGVVSVSNARFNPAGDTALFTATPSTAPTSEKTKDLVRAIRGERESLRSETGATFLVSGTTAVNIDVAQKMQSALVPYLAVVVGLAFLLLLVIFRSVLVPLKAAVGFLLSVLAALGAVVAVFQWGWAADLIGLQQTGPIMSTMPIMMVGIVFGLAMDYEVFLVSRMREAYIHGERPADSVVSGFRHSARVVVAAALIMIAVFSGFVGAGLAMIKMIGFSLAVAVLFDAFLVRMVFVPAVLALLAKRAWWLPHRLDRRLPHVDIEGEALTGGRAATPEPAVDKAAASALN